MAARIEDYALLGDCETAALVNKDGSIDWLCWPTFSSEACFCALLGTEENGYWRIGPADGSYTSTRKYRDHTLILETTFESDEGAVKLIDFMPIRERYSDVVRIVEGLRGNLSLRMELALRFDYGRTLPMGYGNRGWHSRGSRPQLGDASRIGACSWRRLQNSRRLPSRRRPTHLVHADLRNLL